MRIEILREVTDDVVAAFARLLPQLSESAGAVDRATMDRVVAAEANTVLIARSAGAIVGTLTLVTVPTVTGLRARIEDVVVDACARGQGVGAALTERALDLARSAGASSVELTSRASRVAANRLYQRLGFQRRESNLYRYPLR
ncbi:GNAT family N-acetyltransferase [Planosporangium sp. 12N6]|uniref:GNAT family N-acetyltransferase n=1 Tax=Planosporangium spinosum TaxID=3402278 RepID=UPI003CF0B1C2